MLINVFLANCFFYVMFKQDSIIVKLYYVQYFVEFGVIFLLSVDI